MAQVCTASWRQLNLIFRRLPSVLTCTVAHPRTLHTSQKHFADFDDPEQLSYKNKYATRTDFLAFNDVVYAPTEEGEDPRPVEVCYQKDFIPISPKKMWYASVLVRGLSIDEAIKQCEFNKKAGSKIIQKVLLEAQELAIQRYNVEFESNLWVADSFVQLHFMEKGYRKQRPMPGSVRHRFSSYFVRLREGAPPEHYYPPPETGMEKLEDYIHTQRSRRIKNSL